MLPAFHKTKMQLCGNAAREVELSIDLSEGYHPFQQASEIAYEANDDFLQGRIRLPREIVQGNRPVFFRLSLVPSVIDIEKNPLHLNPNLLQIHSGTTAEQQFQNGNFPYVDVDWSHVFRIEDGVVYRVSHDPIECPNVHVKQEKTASANHKNMAALIEEGKEARGRMASKLQAFQNATVDLNLGPLKLPSAYHLVRIAAVTDGCIELGQAGLMFNIAVPSLKLRKDCPAVADVIKQRFQDLYQREISEQSLAQAEKMFNVDCIDLHQVRLLLEIFDPDDLAFGASCLSVKISNSKSKEVGPLQLHDISPAMSCCESETKILVLSSFKLADNVRANFILYNPEQKTIVYDQHHDLMTRIRQPRNCSVVNEIALVFRAPKQDYEVIRKLRHLRLQLRLTVFRPTDKKMSSNSFEFVYLEHGNILQDGLRSTCDFCALFNYHEEMSIGKRSAHPVEQTEYFRDELEQEQVKAAVNKIAVNESAAFRVEAKTPASS